MNSHIFKISNADLIEKIIPFVPLNESIHLVGGAIRDALLNKPSYDLDFVVSDSAARIAQQVAKSLDTHYFSLDSDRDAVRLITKNNRGYRTVLDFTRQRGLTLEEDLRLRDFTINAIAINLRNPQSIIDPLGGIQDLKDSILRACSNNSFINDPIRILRAVRQAVCFKLRISPDTKKILIKALPRLPEVSPERIRDEIFKMLEGPNPASSLRSLEMLGGLEIILPEVRIRQNITKRCDRYQGGWAYTLQILTDLDRIFNILVPKTGAEINSNLASDLVLLKLGKFQQDIKSHLESHMNPERSQRSLIFFAALYQESYKIKNGNSGTAEQITFCPDEFYLASQVEFRAKNLRLSNAEIERSRLTVLNQGKPFQLTDKGVEPDRIDAYRYFRDTGFSGINVCLLSMAEMLAYHGPALPIELWNNHLDTITKLFEAYWCYPDEIINQKSFLSGDDLIGEFGFVPGPEIGKALEMLRENQASGEIKNQIEARLFMRRWLSQKSS